MAVSLTNSQISAGLYNAFWDRAPDYTGQQHWVGILNGGAMTTLEIATFFYNSDEGFGSYPTWMRAPNNAGYTALVTQAYENVFQRAPDSGGLAFYVGQLQAGTAFPQVILNMIANALNANNTDTAQFMNQNQVGIFVAETLRTDNPAITGPALEGVTADPESVTIREAQLYEMNQSLTAFELTPERDIVPATHNLVQGVIGSSDKTSTDVGTFTLGDTIYGNGSTKVELTVNSEAPDVAPRVNMSGVDHLAFVAAADETSVELNASTYGRDISKVSATGATTTNIDVTSLVTEGSFNMTTSPTFGGELVVGNVAFDNSGRMDLASPNTLAGQDDTGYVGGNMVSDLYSENGVKANLYIASGTNAGGSSINLTEGEIEVNAGAGRGSRESQGDVVGAHVFHYVNATDDLVTADNISVDLVDINVAKGSAGEVVISNWADKTADIGDAEALGVDVGAVDINIADGSAAIFEVRNMASNTTAGIGSSVNPAAYAGDITVGNIDSLAQTGSDIDLKILQLASLGEDLGHHGDETAQAGDVTVGDVTTVGLIAGDVSLEVVNKVELLADYVPPGAPSVGDYTGIVGNLEVGDVTMSGTNYGATVTLQNVIEFGALANGTGVANSTVGNTLVGDLNIRDNYVASVYIQDGNEDDDAAQGSITVGTMTVGSVDVAGGEQGQVYVDRNAIADDEDAAIGATNIAVAGTVTVSGDNLAQVDLNVLASSTTTGDTDVAQVTVGNIGTASNANAKVDVNIQALSAVKTNGTVAANVVGVELGNIEANVNNAAVVAGLAAIDIAVEAQITQADAATGYADTATVGDVTIGNLVAFATETGVVGTPLADATVGVVVDANSKRGDATVGDVTLVNVRAVGRDVAMATVTVSASAEISGDASVGDVTLGNVYVSNGLGGESTVDAQFNLLVDAEAGTTADVGGHAATVSSVTVGNVTVQAIGQITGTDAAPDALIDIQVKANALGGLASANQATVTDVDLGTLSAVASNNEDDSDATIGVLVSASASGDATVDRVTIDDITATAEGTAAASVDQSATAHVSGAATLKHVLIGDVNVTGEASTDPAPADAAALAVASANADVGDALVDDIEIGNITATGVNAVYVAVNRNAAALTGDATVDHIVVGDIEATVSATSDSSAIVANTVTAQTGGFLVGKSDAPPLFTAGDASVKNVNLGTVTASGGAALAAQEVGAFVRSNTDGFVAEVKNVNVAAITVTDEGTAPDGAFNSAAAGVHVNASSYTEAIAVNKGEAYIRELTIGNITANAAVGVDGGVVGIDVRVSATADHVGNVDDVTMGNLAITVNDSAEVALRVDVNANADSLWAADGNVGTAVIGDISVIGGENVTDFADTMSGADNDVLDIVALDDIATVSIGNWNIAVGAGSVLDQQDAVIAAGSGGSGYIESVTMGDITRTATGAETVINSEIHIEADQQIQAVTIGDVTNTAVGDAAKVAQAIYIGTGEGHQLDARPQAVGEIVIGDLTANATGEGVETEDEPISTTASIDVLVSSSGDVESLTVGNIAASADGFYAATHVGVEVRATEDVGPVVVGTLALDVSGTTATGDITIGVSGIQSHPTPSATDTDTPTSIESLTVGDVTMNVFGDNASGTVDVYATADATPDVVGFVSIGDLSITLGNDASARTPLGTTGSGPDDAVANTVDAIAYFTADATVGGYLRVGDINLTAQASVEDQLNSAGVQAHVSLNNHTVSTGNALPANVNIGDVTVVGGYYAQSGVTGATATTTGDLNGAITSVNPSLTPARPDVQGGQTLYTQSALSYDFSYDQATGKWSMTGANVEAALTDFTFTQGTGAASNEWTLSGTVSTAGVSDLLTVTFDPDANTVSYDWLAGDGIPTAWSDQTDGVATVSFDGALNNDDAISFSLATGGVSGPTNPQPAALELLDNFNVLDITENEASWLQASTAAGSTGKVFIGDIDYSGYLATPADSGNTTYTADEVTIDISGFGFSLLDTDAAQVIKFAQMASNVTDNAGTQSFVFSSSGEADTLTLVEQNHAVQTDIDAASGFVNGTDTITLETAGTASGTSQAISGDNYSDFVGDALAYLQTTGNEQNLAYQTLYGNTYVAYLSTGSTGLDLNVVQITGVTLTGGDFTAAATDWVIS